MSGASRTLEPGNAADFEQALRAKDQSYHIHHPFNVTLNAGRASAEQIRGGAANRFYYQINIPLKDAALTANCPDPDVRRQWMLRILGHGGTDQYSGGIEAWVELGEAVGISRRDLWSMLDAIQLRFGPVHD